MRQSLGIAAAVVLVIASLGIVGRLAEHPEESARARGPAKPFPQSAALEASPQPTAAIRPVPGSRLEAQRLLRGREFAALTQLVEAKQDRVEADVRREDELARVLLAFYVADPALLPLLDAWVAAQPDSYAPWLARAQHLMALAMDRRGGEYRDETSEKQFEAMGALLRKAVADASEALRRNRKLAEACRILILAASTNGDHEAFAQLAALGLDAAPASLRVRVAIASRLLPRWGGSYGAVEAFARESQTHAGENPGLKALRGFVDWDRGRLAADDERHDEAIALFTSALEAGEFWEFYRDRVGSYMRRKRYTDALADVAQALALRPEEPDVLVLRAWVLSTLGRRSDALADVRLVAELDPTSDDLAWFRRREVEAAVSQGRDLLRSTKDVNGAIERLAWGIQLGGENPELLYWRGRAYITKNDHERALRDFEAAIGLDPRHLESYRNIDWLLARQGRWDEIVRHWSRYIELEPLSGDAFLERAGARRRNGDERAALADVRKACELGTRKACDIVGPLGRR